MIFRTGDILVLIVLTVLAWQDFRSRLISWWLLPLLLAGLLLAGKAQSEWNDIGKYFLLNLGFLGIQFLLVKGWTVLRHREQVRFIDGQIGLGDILFLVCLAAAFSTINFFIFYTASLLFVLLIAIPARLFSKSDKMLIPLAGAISIPLIVLISFRLFVPQLNFYSEEWLLQFLNPAA